MTKSEAISLVLNKFIECYDVDTSVIWPDDSLSELGISDEMIQRVLGECLRDLGADIQRTTADQSCPKNARGLVELVHHHATRLGSSEGRAAA
jgi:hypothetical protein